MPGLFKKKPKTPPTAEKPQAGDKPTEKGKPQAPARPPEKGKPKADKAAEKGKPPVKPPEKEKPQAPTKPPEKEKPRAEAKPPDRAKRQAEVKPPRSSSLGQIYLGLIIFVGIILCAYMSSVFTPSSVSSVSSVSATRTMVPEAIVLPEFNFDSGIDGWRTRGNVSPSEGRAGAGVMVVSAATGKSELWIDIPKNRFQAGEEYRATAWCKTTARGICTLTIMQSDGNGLYQEDSVAGSNDWQQIAVQLGLTPGAQDMRLILDGNTQLKKQDQRSDPPVYYDEVQLTQVK